MKPKIVSKIINTKFNEWCNSIEDENVRKLVQDNSIITGGCIASMLLKEKVNDYDIYFTNKETAFAVANYYVNKFTSLHHVESSHNTEIYVKDEDGRVRIYIKSAGVASEESDKNQYEYFESQSDESTSTYIDEISKSLDQPEKEVDTKGVYRPVFLSANAITLSNQIQIIIRFYGSHDEIHGNYDFVHCTNYWSSSDGKLRLNQAALESLISKELLYVGSRYPLCSIIRVKKFVKRGWAINAGQMLKMIYQVSQLDLNDFNVLEDQLTGVDVAYFHQLIDGLKKHNEKVKSDGGTFKLEYGYLASMIDKIF